MKKPQIIKGEVKEFLYCYTDAMRQSITREDFIDIYAIYSQFYRQAFKPEMITQYFEGWIKEEDWLYSEGPFGLDKNIIISVIEIGIIMNIDDYIYKVFTLSQFITNCIQAGIKLTWKEKQ